MTKRAAVLIIHGMGKQKKDFASDLIRRLNDYLGAAKEQVAIAPCYWANIFQPHEDKLRNRVELNEHARLRKLRDWVISFLGDPPGYLSGFFKKDQPMYHEVHEQIQRELAELERQLDPSCAKPLVVLAHSLGSVMVTNYIWDEEKNPSADKTPFERMETLTKFVTYGSNIPLFIPPVENITCIQFPSPALPAQLKPFARWKNFFAPADLLGYPLNDIWDDRKGTVIEDVSIHPGPFPLSRTPLSHQYYDSDDAFLAPVAREILSLLEISHPA